MALTVKESKLTSDAGPLDLVICLDRSGSMGYGRGEMKLNEAKHLTASLVKNLPAEDRVAVVTFDSTAHIHLPLLLCHS